MSAAWSRKRVAQPRFAGFVLLLALVGVGCAAAESRPNIVLILADDLGYHDTGFNGCSDIATPHLDRVANEGVRFTSGYVCFPVCSPSRAGLLTGRYPQRFGFENNFGYLITNPRVGLPRDEVTIADLLKAAGYRTAAIGKWHLGAHPALHPNRRGFDEFFGFLGGGHDYFSSRRDLDEYAAEILKRGVPEWLKVADPEILSEWQTPVYRNGSEVRETGYLTTEFGREAVRFIERNHAQPFFVYLAFNAPHTPMQVPAKYLEGVTRGVSDLRRLCAAMVSAMDDAVGEVLSALDRLDLAENTIVVFLSDNGGSTAYNGSLNAPFRGIKGDMFEGGIRVPFALRWPRRISGGRRYDEPMSALDIFPTLVAAAEARIPPGVAIDGIDLTPHLLAHAGESPHARLFWRWAGRGTYAVREGSYKLVGNKGSPAKLFDLSSDPAEECDLAPASPALVSRLTAAYRQWETGLATPRWGPKQPSS